MRTAPRRSSSTPTAATSRRSSLASRCCPAPNRRKDGPAILVKAFLLVDLAAAGVVAAVNVDGAAQTIILGAAVLTAVGLLWRNFLRPAAKILVKTVQAVDALETLPKWRDDHDERLADVEAEVGIVHVEVGNVANDVAAIRREFGIGDEDVRRQVPAIEPSRGRPPRK